MEQRSVLSVEAAEKSAAMTVLTGLSATGAAPVEEQVGMILRWMSPAEDFRSAKYIYLIIF